MLKPDERKHKQIGATSVEYIIIAAIIAIAIIVGVGSLGNSLERRSANSMATPEAATQPVVFIWSAKTGNIFINEGVTSVKQAKIAGVYFEKAINAVYGQEVYKALRDVGAQVFEVTLWESGTFTLTPKDMKNDNFPCISNGGREFNMLRVSAMDSGSPVIITSCESNNRKEALSRLR